MRSVGDPGLRGRSEYGVYTEVCGERPLMKLLNRADYMYMIVFAMIAFGWLAMMVLVVSSCGAASLGDQSQEGLPTPLAPQPEESHAVARRRRRTATFADRRTPELQRRV